METPDETVQEGGAEKLEETRPEERGTVLEDAPGDGEAGDPAGDPEPVDPAPAEETTPDPSGTEGGDAPAAPSPGEGE